MTIERVYELIAAGENESVAIFSGLPPYMALAKEIVEFANNKGGDIILMSDGNNIRHAYPDLWTSCLNVANSYIRGDIPEISFEIVRRDSNPIAVISVAPLPPIDALVPGRGSLITGVRKKAILIDLDNNAKDTSSGDNFSNIKDKKEVDEGKKREVSAEESADIKTEYKYISEEIADELSDKGLEPCFGVDETAVAFFKLLKQMSADGENVCFLGVFGQWGRGKTFFLKRLKEIVRASKDNKKYDFITFNAWKYQQTPAIWASLIHTLIQHKSWWGRLRFRLSAKVFLAFLSSFLFLAIAIGCALLAIIDWNTTDEKTLLSVIASGVSLFLSVAGFIQSFGLIDHQEGKKYKPTDLMGVQFRTEKELVRILKRWNWGHFSNPISSWSDKKRSKRKVVLLVEDIDRCHQDTMREIIEALKLIMENPDVANRMIVVASVDPDKVTKAYMANSPCVDDIDKQREALDQLNKIFLMGINLPPVSSEDMQKYIAALANRMLGENEIISADESSKKFKSTVLNNTDFSLAPLSPFSMDLNPLFPLESPGKLDAGKPNRVKIVREKMDNYKSIEMLTAILMRETTALGNKLTPRQMKIIFYRLILANNLLSARSQDHEGGIYRNIIGYSLNSSDHRVYESTNISTIVVPYPVTLDN